MTVILRSILQSYVVTSQYISQHVRTYHNRMIFAPSHVMATAGYQSLLDVLGKEVGLAGLQLAKVRRHLIDLKHGGFRSANCGSMDGLSRDFLQ